MNKQRKLQTWQIVLITLGVVLVFGPAVWEAFDGVISGLLDIRISDVFTRGGMFVVGAILLGVVGIYEFVKDARDKPKSKYIK